MPQVNRYKALRAFQNNGPCYWLIFEGQKVFGATPICRCETEEEAQQIVKAMNMEVNA